VVADLVIWHGTADDVLALSLAIDHNCDCAAPRVCAAHRAMLDQRFLNGVLFGKHLAKRLLAEEFKAR
jgi:hypothetical protein